VLPVWFLLDCDDVIFNTGAETVRGRALRRDGRASMLVDDERPPYSFVRVDGHAAPSWRWRRPEAASGIKSGTPRKEGSIFAT
jgi:hypothetical protein